MIAVEKCCRQGCELLEVAQRPCWLEAMLHARRDTAAAESLREWITEAAALAGRFVSPYAVQ